jgi:hypothetical protein
MRIFKTRRFSKWAEKNEIDDPTLLETACEVKAGQYETHYGQGVIKKRVSNKNRGKSKSTRTIIAFKKGKDCFFIYGFEKSEKANLSDSEEKALKLLANDLFAASSEKLEGWILNEALIEVCHEKK